MSPTRQGRQTESRPIDGNEAAVSPGSPVANRSSQASTSFRHLAWLVLGVAGGLGAQLILSCPRP